jgi:lipoprotein-anchoring transpeptidase ErfK/SrfK
MFVFRDGEVWDSSRVSTGRRGHETPVGTFPILQKKVHHRSNLYDNAPMPFMQRLTWGGVALHAGSIPGYPASHGCIRLPKAFAQKLYKITDFDSTLVVVTDERVDSAEEAQALA